MDIRYFNQSVTISDDTDGIELDLSSKPSWIMDKYRDLVIERHGSSIVVGYLVDDEFPSNPLEEQDGLGKIHTSHRHSRTHADMQQALALDCNWSPDLDLVDKEAEGILMSELRTRFQTEFVAYLMDASAADIDRDAAIRQLVDDYTSETYSALTESMIDTITDWKNWDVLRQEQWEFAVSLGAIGNPYTVMLDCYSHGGEVWSVSGGGTQCQWDTASGAGVWVPDASLTESLDEMRESEGLDAAREQARVYARQCLEVYNAWISGNCYGWCVDSFEIDGAGRAELDAEDSCYGYYGDDDAYASMQEAVAARLGKLKGSQRQAAFDFERLSHSA